MSIEKEMDLLARARAILINIAKGYDGVGSPREQAEAWLRIDAENADAKTRQLLAGSQKRCGTCGEWMVHDGKCGGCGMANHDVAEGPPWPDCRFWKPKEKP